MVNRKDPWNWNDPAHELHTYRKYNPTLWVLVVVEIFILLRWLTWHKLQSLKARRGDIQFDMAFTQSDVEHLLQSDDLTPMQREKLVGIKRRNEKVASKLNLQSKVFQDDE